jgi:uncharacterized protein YqjF (DUF2071 family)
VGLQSWHDLLFAHWPLSLTTLRGLVPPTLEIDTFDGEAWLGIVPFRMSNVRPRWLPALPWISAFPELNVRTYVKAKEQPGVWFFSLDASRRLAVAAARWWYKLPYFFAKMTVDSSLHEVRYLSTRADRHSGPAALSVRYQDTGTVARTQPGSLEYWLTERYCLYTVDRQERLFRAEIHHLPWPLQNAEAEFATNTMTHPLGIQLPPTAPLLHFARRQDVIVWGLQPVG